MIAPDPARPPLSNRGGKTLTPKTNLQLNPLHVLVDRFRLSWHLHTSTKPEDLLLNVFGKTNQDAKRTRRGSDTMILHRAWDGPKLLPGNIYYQAYKDPRSVSDRSVVLTAEFNPRHAGGKIPQFLQWLDSHDIQLARAFVDRLDLAFDFAVPRHQMTVRLGSRRKASLWLPSGGPVETLSAKHSDDNVGVTLYDKKVEQESKGNVTSLENLTRFELRIHPHKHFPERLQGWRFEDLPELELPESLGCELIYMPIPLERFDMTNDHSQYYKACQVVAEYDSLRARKMMVEYARSHGTIQDHAEQLADCLLESVPLGRIWEDSRGETWRQIENQFSIPGSRPQINISK